MPSAFIKDIYREIVNTKGRFFGILAIVALGVAFFTGLGATGYDMKQTGHHYFVDRSFMDIRVVGTYGLNDNDIKAIAQVPGIAYMHPTYSMDAQITHNGNTGNIKLHAYDADAPINRPLLISGSMPQKSNEAVVEADLLRWLGYSLGDTVTLQSGKEADIRNRLRNRSYVITGVVESPHYISRERGTSSIGRGEVDFYMFIPQSNFLSDVYTELAIRVEGADEIICFTDDYKDYVDIVVTAIEAVGDIRAEERAREMTAGAYAKLKAAEEALTQQYINAQLSFSEAEAALAESSDSLSGGYTSMTDILADITRQETALDESLALVQSALQSVREAETLLAEQEATLWASRQEVMAYEPYLGAEFSDRMRDIDDGLAAITTARSALSEQRQSLYGQWVEITEGKEALRQSLATASEAGRSLVMGGYDVTQGQTEWADERQTQMAKLEEARVELAKTREALNDLTDPKWYVLTRDANPGYPSYSDDTGKIEAIGRVFPLIFFIVAALVCLTTMTRLVEERRTEIGTLKSLGYGNSSIISKYVIYAVMPTVIGGLAGGYVGMTLFPQIIISAYGMLYTLPDPETPMHMGFWAAGLGMGLASTGLATVFACASELRETPSNLLRPKAPKAGKRNILESLPFLWQRLTFIQKVTVRNLLRYKKRLYMTVIGIGGCTALLLTGFGLRDSIADIIYKQFSELSRYDLVVDFTDSAPEKDVTRVNDVLQASPISQRSIKAYQKTMDTGAISGDEKYQATLVVPETTQGLDRFFNFRDRVTHDPQVLTDNGVIITEKLSRLLAVEVGDSMELMDGDSERVTVRVAAITETYFMHYVYMTPAVYQQAFGEKPVNNSLYALLAEADDEAQSALAQVLLDEKGVGSVFFVQSTVRTFGDVIENLNFVVFVLIVSAGALALVVLLNLTNININERIRELATIEVLGFYDREVSAYVYRENVILTLMGAALGLFLGYFLHLYVILTAETDIMMFGRDIKPASFGLSVALTFFFAFIVNMLTASRLKKINMVEALKSVE